MKKLFFSLVLSVAILSVSAQRITPEQYIDMYKDLAILEMERTGIPASVTLAQGLLETESGNSELVKMSNNHFGIKCKKEWTGETVAHTDDAPNECFRKYPKAEDSYKDHSNYLKNSPRYASLFQLEPGDYKGWAYGLKRAGYATNPRYPQILITNIERYNLQQYDLLKTIEVKNDAVFTEMPVEAPVMKIEVPDPDVKNVVPDAGKKATRNGLKVIYIMKGTSLLAVATGMDVPLLKLLEYNDLTEDGLVKNDQWLYLEKKYRNGTGSPTYTASDDLSLYEISQINGVWLKSLSEYNNLSPSAIVKKGTVIRLRP